LSKFPTQQSAIAYLIAQVENLKARMARITTSGGQIRITSTTIAGGLPGHDHSDVANAGKVEYTSALPSDWNGSTDPGDVWRALDQLAARVKSLEQSNGGGETGGGARHPRVQ